MSKTSPSASSSSPFDQARALLEASRGATPWYWDREARTSAPSLAAFIDGPVRELVEAAREVTLWSADGGLGRSIDDLRAALSKMKEAE